MKKMCWIAKEYKKGWRLGMAYGSKFGYLPFWLSYDETKSLMNRKMLVRIWRDK